MTLRLAQIAVQYGCAIHLFTTYIGNIHITDGPSMLPTMSLKGDIVLEDCLSIRLNQISRGDIITATSPLDPGRKVSKRVLGLQGDIVCVDPLNPTQHIVVPKNHLWVMGDNHAVSNDSRVYGPLPMGLVKGKLICRLWPRPTMFTDYMQYID